MASPTSTTIVATARPVFRTTSTTNPMPTSSSLTEQLPSRLRLLLVRTRAAAPGPRLPRHPLNSESRHPCRVVRRSTRPTRRNTKLTEPVRLQLALLLADPPPPCLLPSTSGGHQVLRLEEE